MLKKGKSIIMKFSMLGLSFAMLSACTFLPQEEAALKPPLVKPVKESLDVFEVKKSSVSREIQGFSTFVSEKSQYAYFRESGGRLMSIDVKSGDTVKKGDVLARLEKGDLEAKIRQQQLAVEKANILLEQTKAEKNGDPQAIRLKMIDVESSQIGLDLLKEQLSRTLLISDLDGIVTYLDPIKPGDQVTGFKSLIGISDPKQVMLVYEFTNPNDIVGIQVQMDATIKYKDKVYNAKVVQTPASAPITLEKSIAERNARTIVLSVNGIADPVIGQQATFVITLEKKDDVIVIPKAGLRSYMGRDYVQVLEGESRKEVDVEKGIVSATNVEIRKGLKEGQKVILNQ